MKLRIHGNSLRLRLSPTEVDRLLKAGAVWQETIFANDQKLIYALRIQTDIPAPTATFDSGAIVVDIPRTVAAHWAAGDDVGISATSQTVNGHSLKILVEKEFECLHGDTDATADDAGALYPNPRAKG